MTTDGDAIFLQMCVDLRKFIGRMPRFMRSDSFIPDTVLARPDV
jgi:hypothetical protein